MKAPEDLFIMDLNELHADLFRMGNSTSPNFSEGRGFKDLTIRDQGGTKVVVANGNGYSASSVLTAKMKAQGRNLCKVRKGSSLPDGIKLVGDLTNPIHFMFAPANNMPFKKFLGLLEELATNPLASVKMTPQEIIDAR